MSVNNNKTTTGVLLAIAAANKLTNTSYQRQQAGKQHHDTVASILDALATTLVGSPRGEVVAVGVQADYGTPGSATLTVAANTRVPQAAEAHLRQVWQILGELSEHEQDKNKKSKNHQTFAEGIPERAHNQQLLPSQYYFFVKLIYSYCFPKFSYRLEKWHDIIANVVQNLKQRIRAGDLQLDKTLDNLIYVLLKLLSYHRCDRLMLQQDSFVQDMTAIFFTFQDLQSGSEKGKLVDILGKESFNNTWRFMEKGLEFQASIMDLDRLACSRYMSPILMKELKINRLPASKGGKNLLPSEISDWHTAARAAMEEEQLEETDKFKPSLKKAYRKYQGKKCLVHSEIKILEYFVNRPTNSAPPLSYIGMSKPSCLGCWTTINAWNNNPDTPKYVVRGTDGKWCFPWAVPSKISKKDAAAKRIHEDLQKEVVHCLKGYDLCRLPSDSSVNSNRSQWTSYSVGEERI